MTSKKRGEFVSIQFIYYAFLLLLALCGYYMFLKHQEIIEDSYVKVKKNRFDHLREMVRKSVDDIQIHSIFNKSGLPITAYQYQFCRYCILAFWLVIIVLMSRFQNGGVTQNQIFLLIVMYMISSPKTHIFGKRTPFKWAMDTVIENRRVKQTGEIYRSILQLKNIAITKKNNPPGSLFILEQLRKFSKTTRPTFNMIISMWHEGKIDNRVHRPFKRRPFAKYMGFR